MVQFTKNQDDGRGKDEAPRSTADAQESVLAMSNQFSPIPSVQGAPWNWQSVHSILCDEPRAAGLVSASIEKPSLKFAHDLATIFSGLGQSDLAELCARIPACYQGTPALITPVTEKTAWNPPPEVDPDSNPEFEERMRQAEAERCSLQNHTLLHWSWGDVLFFAKGSPIAGTAANIPLCGHSAKINGALCLEESGPNSKIDQFLSWSDDGTLRLWRVGGGTRQGPSPLPEDHPLAQVAPSLRDDTTSVTSRVLVGHTGSVLGALPLPDGRIVSWGKDATIRLWSGNGDGTFSAQVLRGHSGPVRDVRLLRDGHLCSIGDREIIHWN